MNLRKTVLAATLAIVAFAAAGVGFTVAAQSSYYSDLYTTSAADSAATAGVLGFSAIYFVCICCLPLVIDLVLAYWIYTDAKKHNVENPALWAVLTFFFSLIGLLIYLLAIRPEAIKKMEGGHTTHPAAQVVEGSTVEDKKPE